MLSEPLECASRARLASPLSSAVTASRTTAAEVAEKRFTVSRRLNFAGSMRLMSSTWSA